MHAEELEVDEQEIHLGVADALADAERGAVHAVGAGFDGGHAVREPEAAIVVPVPVDAHVELVAGDDLFAHEAHERAHAVGRRVADGVREADAPRAARDRGAVERASASRGSRASCPR